MTHTTISRRRLLGGLGAAAAATGLVAGCDGRPAQGNASSGSGELSFMLLGPDPQLLSIFNDTLIPGFAKDSGVTVTLQTSDWGSGFQKVVTAAASHTLPDVLTVGGIWTAPLVAKKALRPLDPYLGQWSDKDQFYPSMLEDAAYEGKTYAVPVYADVRTVAYRKDFFTEAGLDPAKPPKSWDDYKGYAAKLVKTKGKDIVRQGADWSLDTSIGLQQAYAQLILQAGGTYYTQDGKGNFASDQGERALTYLVSFFKEGLSSVNYVQKPTAPQKLVSGTTAMQFVNMGVLQNAKTNDAKVEPLILAGDPLAVDASAKPITSAWINKFAISADSKNPDAAWKWLQYIAAKVNLEKLDAQYGLLPPRKDLTSAAYLDGVPKGFITASDYVVPQPPNTHMLEIAQVINKELQSAVRLQTTVPQTLEAIDKQINDLVGS